MTEPGEAIRSDVIEEVVRRVRERLPGDEAELVETFVRRLYEDVAAEDLQERGALDLYGAALTLWGLTARRRPGEVKLRVFSPRLEDHGWDSRHTVLQVVCDDTPFLVDSVTMELNRHGLATHLVVHPVVDVRRDRAGQATGVWPLGSPDRRLRGSPAEGEPAEGAAREALMHVETDRQTDPGVLERLHDDVARVLGDVRVAVEDWQPMRDQVHAVVAELTENPPPVDPDELAEAVDFLRWLEDDHFTFLGFRTYDLTVEDADAVALRSVPGTGLGVLRAGRSPRAAPDDLDGVTSQEPTVRRLTGEPAALARTRSVLVLTKANTRATVHRPTYLDYVGVRRFSPDGEVVGEWRFLGLYTSVVYNNTPRDVPVLRQRIQRVLDRAGFVPHSHNEKALLDVLETHPRDELLQTSSQELYPIAMGILRLKDRPRVALFVRPDPYKRFLSCLVYVPRERYSTTVRERIEEVLTSAFNGTVADWSVHVAESALARLHVIVRTHAHGVGDADLAEIRDRLVRASRSWTDDLRTALLEHHDEETGNRLFAEYADAFPAAYREDVPARNAVADIERLEALAGAGIAEIPATSLYQPLEAPPGSLRFKLLWPRSRWRDQAPLLSDVLPVLENMGVRVTDQRPYELRGDGSPTHWILDFGLLTGGVQHDWERDAEAVKRVFQEAFLRVWHADAENDGFNRLVLGAGLTWRQVSVIRAYAKYLRQAGSTFSQPYMERTLAANPEIARHLVELFTARFDPDPAAGHAGPEELTKLIESALDEVASLDQDRILRSFLTVISATTRTNYFQHPREDGGGDGDPAAPSHKGRLALKLDPARIPFLPQPRPVIETFVYSSRVEGVHLRGARVARGGIRHSDRQEDYRTEVLGLMKAQTVKNAVIVPGGAKGGFVVKRPPAGGDRDALAREVRACYATFIRGLLDLTDNRPQGASGSPAELIPPPAAVCYDGPDPYLVVAADKGTATFSDLANEIAAEYRYWLGDAFASGGSAGYDHKKMGITARGAWESVRWHFHELGIDPHAQDFTAVGIGDMSGDVFGNGMLWSRRTKLVAAFNHQHIFIDPDPDPEVSYAERERLFALPRSTWAQYDPATLSPGGGVYERTAKAVELSPEARRALAVEATTLTPHELIRAILLAPVVLLFNGGIGTYVKAAHQTHADAGDRANDPVRVDGAELRCRVVAEGGNLGFTQPGRIEYALAGGRVNTDFIDNSAGVDTSDHEVNIKILLNEVVAAGDMTRKQRNELLETMTGDVAALVLRDNYRQAESLSVSESHAHRNLQRHAYALRGMERAGILDRAQAALPDRRTLAERRAAGKGLTRPELAVLLAHGKIAVKSALLDSDLPEDPYLSRELEYYLPAALQRFREQMRGHRLRREIVATHITNSMINRAGGTFAFMVGEETGAAPPDIVRAYTVAREVFGLRALWTEVEALDRVHANVRIGMLREGRKLTERATVWLLRRRRPPLDVAAEVGALTPAATGVAERLGELLVGAAAERHRQRAGRLTAQDVPEALARRVAGLPVLLAALDISDVAAGGRFGVQDVAAVHFHVNARLDVEWLRHQVADDAVQPESQWHELAWASLREDLNAQHRAITASVLARAAATGTTTDPAALVDAWTAENEGAVRRLASTIGDLKASDAVDLAMASVGLRELRRLAQTGGGA